MCAWEQRQRQRSRGRREACPRRIAAGDDDGDTTHVLHVCVFVCVCVCMCVYVCLGGLKCLLACLKHQRTQLMARLFAATPSIRRASAGCWKGTWRWRAPLWHHGVQSRSTSARRERAVGTGSRCWECSQGSARRSLSGRVHSRTPTRSLHHKPHTHIQTLVSLGIPRQKTRRRLRWRNRTALVIPAAGRPANKHPSSATDVSARVFAREGRRSGARGGHSATLPAGVVWVSGRQAHVWFRCSGGGGFPKK